MTRDNPGEWSVDSPLFSYFVDQIAQRLRKGAHDLVMNRADVVARSVLAALVEQYGFAPDIRNSAVLEILVAFRASSEPGETTP